MMRRAIAAVVLFVAGVLNGHAELMGSAVKVDITPSSPQWLMGYGPRKSTAVHDKIYHRIAALSDGTTTVFIVASDLCVFSPSVYDDFVKDMERETGIKREQVWWTVTHTHSAPEVGPPGMYDVLLKGRSDHEWDRDYLKLVTSKLKEGILQAKTELKPARLRFGQSTAKATINRRGVDVDGKVSLGMNPDGVVDQYLGVVRIERPDGQLVALITNYAMHGTAMNGKWTEISGDAPGVVTDFVEQKVGGVMLYVNGAAGNVAPIYSVYDNPKAAHLGEFRVLLGNKIIDMSNKLSSAAEVSLTTSETWVETERKPGLGWPAELGAYKGEGYKVRIPVRALRMGYVAAWGAPVELFSEVAMRVRAESPFTMTLFFGYSNGWLGYLPTAKAFAEGGYEPNTSPFTPKVERDFGDGVIRSLLDLNRK